MSQDLNALEFFAAFIKKELGIEYSEANFFQLETRLLEVAQVFGMSTLAQLHERVRTNFSADLQHAVREMAVNNETLFFREPGIFQLIKCEMIEKVASTTDYMRPYRIWSAACSFGQEVYSLAMLCEQVFRPRNIGYEILASDVAMKALAATEKAVYTDMQVNRGLTRMHLEHYFDQVGSVENQAWQAKACLRRNLQFKRVNLIQDFSEVGYFDMILCRNVLIYQSVESRRDIVARLTRQLSPGGYLVLGAAESLIGINDDFEQVRSESATIFRLKTSQRMVG